jgi:hypothetical protein
MIKLKSLVEGTFKEKYGREDLTGWLTPNGKFLPQRGGSHSSTFKLNNIPLNADEGIFYGYTWILDEVTEIFLDLIPDKIEVVNGWLRKVIDPKSNIRTITYSIFPVKSTKDGLLRNPIIKSINVEELF